MRKAALLLGTLALLSVLNGGAYLNERLLREGRFVLLELAPRDPRSLMQGDYMALRFVVAGDASRTIAEAQESDDDNASDGGSGSGSGGSGGGGGGGGDGDGDGDGGKMVLSIDEDGVGHFARLADTTPLAPDEALLAFRSTHGGVRLATDAWFFEEGTAARYEPARYGGFRLASDGRALLVSVHDEHRVAIEPEPSP